ncbi:MAB_1171c family putative transporter [Nocardia sp. NPDC051832]|uniref:MAB_1171c family putative transporter n=1 Tax=Nocardia sp. NPDC051832 TaxID=3155673 RepID=UPI003419EBC9
MTSAIPGVIQWPAFGFVALVIVGRYLLVDQTSLDRLATRALTFGLVCDLLRNNNVQQAIADTLWLFDDAYVINVARQASFGPLLLSIMCLFGMARIAAAHGDDAVGSHRQYRYDAVALIATAVILVAGTPARAHDMLIDEYHGWPAAIVWIAYYSVLAASSLSIVHIMVGELRDGDNTIRENIIYVVVLAYFGILALQSIYLPAQTVAAVLTDSPAKDPTMQSKAISAFVALIVGAAIIAVPLVGAILLRSGWDRPGRYCRKLRPLWRDLTDIYPEVVLERPGADSVSQLHRMTMEIRDCLARLHRYAPEAPEYAPAGSPRDELCDYARRISAAVTAKQSGQLPPARPTERHPQTPQRRDLAAELNQLVELARVWRRVHPTTAPLLTGPHHTR